MFKVEKNVINPRANISGSRKYPFPEMDVGDSILVDGDLNQIALLRSAAVSWGRAQSPTRKFSTRKTPEGYRCWRVE